jgi:hypothetical protein
MKGLRRIMEPSDELGFGVLWLQAGDDFKGVHGT